MISLTSFISPDARIGRNVQIAPFVYIDRDVEIGDDCEIMPYTSIMPGTTLGSGNRVFAGSILGAALAVGTEEPSGKLVIGNDNVFREHCIITAGSHGRTTRIGNGNLLGADVHVQSGTTLRNRSTVRPGCKIGEACDLANAVLLQHMVLLRPGTRVGTLAEVQALCNVGKDVPPYVTFGGADAGFQGLNLSRLEQAGVPAEAVARIRAACHLIFSCGCPPAQAVERIEARYSPTSELHNLLDFINHSTE